MLKIKKNYNPSKLPTTAKFSSGLKNAFNNVGAEMTAGAKASMKHGKTGKMNPKTGKRRSSPGEPLANDSGATSKSIGYNLGGDRYMDFGGKTKQLAVWEGSRGRRFRNRPTLLRQVDKYKIILKNRIKSLI